MSDFSLEDIDFNEAGEWPLLAQAGVALLAFGLVVFLSYYFLVTDINKNIEQEIQKEAKQIEEFKVKHLRTAYLDEYKKQLKEMESMLSIMLRQLPRKSEVPDLLVDISRAGIVSGLEFKLFKPDNEVPVDFYAELPINIRVQGSFHQLGQFVESLSGLSRIVTLHDFSIINTDELEPGVDMTMAITAKTYRYFDK
jgi:type IV pilus assembly protein PilO